MSFAQWLIAHWASLVAILQQIEALFPQPAPVPGPLKAKHVALGAEMQQAAIAAGIDWSKLANFAALVEKWLPVLISLFGQTTPPVTT